MTIPSLLIIPLAAGLLTQVTKFIIEIVHGEWRWEAFFEYGGMPSAHTAFVVSLTTAVGLREGLASADFAIAFIFSLLVIRDATGLRQFLGQHGRVLNMLIRELPDQEERKFPQKLAERLGHTPLQALVGGLIGLLSALVLYRWLPITPY